MMDDLPTTMRMVLITMVSLIAARVRPCYYHSFLWLIFIVALPNTGFALAHGRRTTVDRSDSEPAVVLDWQNNFGWEAPHQDLQYKDGESRRRTQADLDYTADGLHQPLRIRFLTDPIESRRGESDVMDAEIDAILNEILPSAVARWSNHLSVIPVSDGIQVTESNCFLQVGNVTFNQIHRNTDLVIIVGGEDFVLENGERRTRVCFDTTLAVASPCILDQFDRPVVGFMNFCLGRERPPPIQQSIQDAYAEHIGVTLRNEHMEQNLAEIAVHEMGHVLGQTSWLLKYFRDENGDPRTERPFQRSNGFCPDGTVEVDRFPSTNTIQIMPNSAGGRSYYVVTPRVQQVVRNHFNCQDMIGARLEDGNRCIGTHWHERDFYGELLGPAYTSSSENVLSPLTLAYLDDSGWYQVNYRGSIPQAFGLGAGCEFVNEPCIIDNEVPSWGVGSFCSDIFRYSRGGIQTSSLNRVVCDPGHRSWAICDLLDESTLSSSVADDNYIRYFSNPSLVAAFEPADYCPIPDFGIGLDCTRDDPYVAYFRDLEAVGETSRCINAEYTTDSGQIAYSPACMQVECDSDAGVVRIGPSSAGLVCGFDGQKIAVPGFPGEFLECPRLRVVCPDLFACPASCSGRGVCNYDGPVAVCECFEDGVVGNGCYQPPEYPTPPPTSEPTDPPPGVPSSKPSNMSATPSRSSSPPMPTSTPTKTFRQTNRESDAPSSSPTSEAATPAFTTYPTQAVDAVFSAGTPLPMMAPCVLVTLLSIIALV